MLCPRLVVNEARNNDIIVSITIITLGGHSQRDIYTHEMAPDPPATPHFPSASSTFLTRLPRHQQQSSAPQKSTKGFSSGTLKTVNPGSHEEHINFSITMASSMGLFNTSVIPDDQSIAGLALENLAMGARPLIAEAERFVLEGRGALLPAGWAGRIRAVIDEAEAQIRSEQASHVSEGEHQQVRDSWDSTETWWRSKKQVVYSSTEASCQGTSLAGEGMKPADTGILAELSNHNVCIKQDYSLAEPNTKLDELQQDVHALLSIIATQMADFQSLQHRQTSELAWFSVLGEESAILIDLKNQIEDLYEPSQGMGERLSHEVLQGRFDALPVQLQAVFNMQCHERESQGGEIDDAEMMIMVLENQKRTDLLRSIQNILGRTEDVLHEMGRG